MVTIKPEFEYSIEGRGTVFVVPKLMLAHGVKPGSVLEVRGSLWKVSCIETSEGCDMVGLVVQGVTGSVDYRNEDLEERAQRSSLWPDLERQQGLALPYMIERFLLLRNYANDCADAQYASLILAHVCTVLLSQEERLRKLESAPSLQRENK